MRSKKAFYNTLTGFIYQIIAIVCAFILPRLILSKLGSGYNGVVTSIYQFLSWISVLSAGIGGVTRAALYKPLAENDSSRISSIMNATDSFMKKIALIFVGILLAFASVYPLIVREEFVYTFVFSLVLVLGINTFSQYYFGITYQTLLEADQKQYIYTIVRIITTIIGTIVAASLLVLKLDVRLVYLASSIVYACNPIFLNFYVRKTYCIDSKVEADYTTVKQRWNAFAQELAIMVNGNTDVIVLTVFCGVKIVSVYTVYNMIINGVRQLLQTFTTGVGAAFGNMMAQNKDNKYLNDSLKLFEFVVINATTILFSIAAMTIIPFVKIYVHGVNDVNYIREGFGYLITYAAMFNCFRIPYQTIVYASGRFKETRNGSIIEALINIVISLILVRIIGLEGVVIGTLIAAIFRTSQYALFLEKNIILRRPFTFISNIAISLLVSFVSIMLFKMFVITSISSYEGWLFLAIKAALIVIPLMVLIDILFYREQLKGFIMRLSQIMHIKKF